MFGFHIAEVAKQLRRAAVDNVSVITYALNIAVQLSDTPNISLIMIGGILRQVSTRLTVPRRNT